MCHEPTSFALGKSIGIGKGSVRLNDFAKADVILVVGQNPGSNHPRMLTTLEEAKRAGAKIVAINPLPEAGLLRFKNPQRLRGLVGHGTQIADLHLPIRLGGDQALFQLWNHWRIQRDAQLANGLRPEATGIDHSFIDAYTSGYVELADHLAEVDEAALLGATGLGAAEVGAAFELVAGARRALEAEFGVTMPRKKGHDTVDAVRAFADAKARILISLGGNFVRATPDTDRTEAALMASQLTVQISTKLNRSHLLCGDTAIILPALGRTDADTGPNGDQFVTVEDSMGLIHRSTGPLVPSPELRSEATIICDLASAVLGADHPVPWAAMRSDNDLVRNHIAKVVPGFSNFNERVRAPGGFELPHPPRDERRFPTPDGKAHFTQTTVAAVAVEKGKLLLQTLRSHDQYNTTIYGHDDRYRGIAGDRRIIMVNPSDITNLGFVDGDRVDVISLLAGPQRRVRNYRIVAYPTPPGSAAAYYPEANVLLSLDHHGPDAQTPAAKAIPIRIEAATSSDNSAP